MASIFGIIGKYQAQLWLLPLLSLVFVLFTVILYFLFPRFRKLKYLPAIVGLLLGVILMAIGFMNFTTENGLRWVWYGTATFVGACIGLGTAWLLALFTGLPGMNDLSKKMGTTRTPKKRKKMPPQGPSERS